MPIPTVEVAYTMMVSRLRFRELAKAQTMYDKLSGAVKSYRRFGNDEHETVEIETEDGKCLFKLEHIQNVMIDDGSGFESELRKQLETEKLARSIREELGLPELAYRKA